MARYLVLLRFTGQGARAIKASPGRAQKFKKAAQKAGVKVEAHYWLLGGYDGALLLSADDGKKVLRLVTSLAALGNVQTETFPALDAKLFSQIVGK
jgi:uncharacterized protein with GYD domain